IESLGLAEKADAGKASEGAFSIVHVSANLITSVTNRPVGRFVRVEIPGKEKILSLAEVQVFKDKDNLALRGEASQSTTAYEGPAKLAIDGNTNGDYDNAKSTTHTDRSENPWWEVDLKTSEPIERVVLWNRTDSELQSRLKDFRVALLVENRKTVWERSIKTAP